MRGRGPSNHALAEFDHWQQTKHLVDLVGLPGVRRVSYYATRTSGIPQAWQGSGNRMAAYWAEDLDGLKRWMSDPGLAAAIEDGSQFFDSFNELDDSTYTGNVYQTRSPVAGRSGALSGGVSSDAAVRGGRSTQHEEFDTWIIRKHLPGSAEHPGISLGPVGEGGQGTSGAVLQLTRQSGGVGGNGSAGGA